MADPVITNVDIGSVVLVNAQFRDDLLAFAGAGTVLVGTILARKSVADAVTVVAGSNTGDGTVTLATVAAGQIIPVVGAYNFECTAVVTNGGVFKLEDPNGTAVASGISLTVGAGATTVVDAAGLTFTVTDGATDFIIGDSFALTVAADGDLVPFATDGAGGAQVPIAILTYEVTATGAADIPIRAGVAGSYRKERLVIDADGDDSNIDAAVMDQLRNYGLVPIDVKELNILDNQP